MNRAMSFGMLILIIFLLCTGCTKNNYINKEKIEKTKFIDENNDGVPDDGNYSLQVWEGNWVGIDEYLHNADMNHLYNTIAKKKNISVGEVKTYVAEKYKNDISSFFLRGNTLVIFASEAQEGSTVHEYEYYKKKKYGNENWHIFKLRNKKGKYLYIALTEKKQTESGTRYFALKCGNKINDFNKNKEYYPIKVHEKTSSEHIALLIQALE